MNQALLGAGFALLGVAAGTGIGYYLREQKSRRGHDEIMRSAEELLNAASIKETEVLAKAKEKAIKILEDARLEEKRALEDVRKHQDALLEREQSVHRKNEDIDKAKAELELSKQHLADKHAEAEKAKHEAIAAVERVAGLTKEQAVEHLLKRIETDHNETLVGRMKKLEEQGGEELDRKAKSIMALIIQKQASSHVAETTTTLVELPSEEMKGRIIGREGRNIKAIELLTGCELIIDDTPGAVTVSGFSPIRRQVAKRALQNLINDGRIHPGRIEEFVDMAKKDLAVDIKKAGEDALFQIGIPVGSIDPKFTQIVGRLKFRTSYGQNALMHSLEVAQLSGLLAEELGADVSVCKMGGLFHDVGKAVDHDMQGSHPELGYQIMKKYGFPEEICYQSIGHHEDNPKTLEAIIVKAADAISGARPGARKDSLEFYVKRLKDLEHTAMSFEGVEKVYAIQAGREIRVFVNPSAIDDYQAAKLARAIAKKIESEMKFPGEVRVTVIRETRTIEYAR